MAVDVASPARGRDLFSPACYGQNTGIAFANGDAAWAHHLTHGAENDCDPAPHFLSRWYRWQNPDAAAHDSILDHFATVGATRLIDPSPFVDLTQIGRTTGTTSSVAAYRALLAGTFGGKDGFFPDYAELHRHQAAFLAGLKIETLFDRRTTPRKRLVWVQMGPGSAFRNWFAPHAARNWDLVLNWYGFDAVDLSMGDFAFAQRGTKFTGLAQALKTRPELFAPYEQVLLLDDDLIFTMGDIDRLFQTAGDHGLSLFQAGLTPDSQCIWAPLRDKRRRGVVRFNTVEIMMPGFSMDFLRHIAPVFDRTVSGFGLDLAYGEIARNLGLKAGVVFDVRARHLKPIDTIGGAYYDYMRKSGINPKLELWQLIEDYAPDLEIKPV